MRKLHLALDEFNRWRVFDAADALGEFGSWDEADAFRKSVGKDESTEDDAPAWTPKSGGY